MCFVFFLVIVYSFRMRFLSATFTNVVDFATYCNCNIMNLMNFRFCPHQLLGSLASDLTELFWLFVKWRILSQPGKIGTGKNTQKKFSTGLEKLSTWLLSSGQEFDEMFLDSKHVLKVYFKPSRKKNILYCYQFQFCLAGSKFST